MHLLNLTLSPPTAITAAVYGNFTSAQAQEFIVARGNTLDLLRPDASGKMETIISTNVFGVIRSILPFRLTGGIHDYLVVGSDSGKIVVIKVDTSTNTFAVCQNETYGKTGCRRITPGQYLASDPKGRALMISAVEKQKLVYVMNRDASNRLTISSPLEAHRSHTVHFDVVGVDVGFENPIFACLELNHAEADMDPTGQAAQASEKALVYYELDLGLNHVTRRWSKVVARSANKLVAVPGGNDGPGGVLVIAQGMIQYQNENHPSLSCYFPTRSVGVPNPLQDETKLGNSIMIVSTATHKQRDLFFVLMQSEWGDLFKISLEYAGSSVQKLRVQYFDTIPVALSLCITKTGLLFAASEFSNHYLFQFLSIGEDDDAAQCVSTAENDLQVEIPSFSIRKLKNLAMISNIPSISPITQLLVDDFANEQTPQLYALCGQGNRSSLRILRHGLPVMEMAASALPGVAKAVWCLKESFTDTCDKYIVVSFEDATLVLEIGDTVEEITNSGLLRDHSSLLVALLQDNSMLQVHQNGFRHIRKAQPVTEWKAPGKKVIERCAANARQVVVSLAGGEVIYFELGVNELMEKGKLDLGFEITSLDVGHVPQGRQRFPFLAIGSWDNTVRVLSLDPNDLFRQKSTLALTSHPHTLCFSNLQTESASGSEHTTQSLFLNIGLHNGVFQQTRMDSITATLSDSFARFLGTKPVKLFCVTVQGKPAILALSSRAWLSYYYQTRRQLMPLSTEMLHYASSFHSEQCPEGLAALTAEGMKILTLDHLGDLFNQQKCFLRYTPRRMVLHPPSRRLIIIESDYGEANAASKQLGGEEVSDVKQTTVSDQVEDEDEDRQALLFPRAIRSHEPGKWASCVRIFDPIICETIACHELEDHEHTRSIATCVFHDRGGEVFVIIGSVKNLRLHPLNAPYGGLLRVYRVVEGSQLVLVHTTQVDGIPYAMIEFQGRLLVSVGKVLRIYDLGKRKLLRKCENRFFTSPMIDLKCAGDRIYASDVHESIHFVKYKVEDNQLITFADDCVPHFMTSSTLLDYDTIAGGDKFGNVFVTRLPAEVSDEIDNPTGNRMLWDTGLLNGAPHKLEQIAQFHVGEVITCVLRTSLVPGGMEVILYATILGRIGALVPFTSRDDVDFYTHLEMYMRQEKPPLCGRDHLSYRSFYIPVKNVTDGDLCEQFSSLGAEKQKSIAQDLDRTPTEIVKKLQDTRNRVL
ncbi:hypothetical protein ABG067_003968 [Albugo candida]